jgi:hypothetical protein
MRLLSKILKYVKRFIQSFCTLRSGLAKKQIDIFLNNHMQIKEWHSGIAFLLIEACFEVFILVL